MQGSVVPAGVNYLHPQKVTENLLLDFLFLNFQEQGRALSISIFRMEMFQSYFIFREKVGVIPIVFQLNRSGVF